MDIERRKNQLIVSLTEKEVIQVQEGGTVGERGGLYPDSKIEVSHMSNIDPDDPAVRDFSNDRLDKGARVPLKGGLFQNGDLTIYIPNIALRDVRITHRTLIPDQVEVVTGPEEMRKILPEKGVQVNFGGSLIVVDVTPL